MRDIIFLLIIICGSIFTIYILSLIVNQHLTLKMILDFIDSLESPYLGLSTSVLLFGVSAIMITLGISFLIK